MESITRIATFYWACLLYHRQMFGFSGLHSDLHRQAVSKTTSLLFYRYRQDSDKRRQARVVWPTLMAAVETRDPIHRSWLMERLRDARHLTVECVQIWSMAQEALGKGTAPRGRISMAQC